MAKRTVLLVKPQPDNLKKEDVSEDFFTQLTEILKGEKNFLSAEIALYEKFLWFFLTCPSEIKEIVKGQWHSHYPQAEIEEIKDYIPRLFSNYNSRFFVGRYLYYDQPELIPIKTYHDINKNPLISLSGLISSFVENEAGFIQLVLQPRKKETFWDKIWKGAKTIQKKENYQLLQEKKKQGSYFETTIRFLAIGPNFKKASLNLSSMITIYKKSLERPYLQKLKESHLYKGQNFAKSYQLRSLEKGPLIGKKYHFKFSCAEIATFFHLPYKEEEITQVVQARAKKAAPPQNLPKIDNEGNRNLAVFAQPDFQNEKVPFGIKTNDRRRHLYIIGKTGMGKSKLIELLMKSDLKNGKGMILIDPHGDLSKEILNFIPDERIKDVVYFNPADTEYPIGFNPMEKVEKFEFKQNIVNGFVSVFKKFFSLNWNERFEHVLRYTILALLDYPQSSILGISRMLTDNMFRQKVIGYVTNPLVKKFWATEFSTWNEEFASEAIVPIINKIGQFTADPMIRNIVGQAKTGFSLDEIMNQGKIFIANLTIGKLGEENSALLGSMLITKVWQTAISRADTPEEKRRDCFMYIDEFQNFATTAFSHILSEARKYRLNLTIAHQYVQQLPQEIEATIFGNVGNIISFRVGGEDAKILVREFEPTFGINDFLNLDVRNFLIKMSIDGQTSQPFSARTIYLKKPTEDKQKRIIELSRQKWAKTKQQAEEEIRKWEKGKIKLKEEKEREDYFPEPIT